MAKSSTSRTSYGSLVALLLVLHLLSASAFEYTGFCRKMCMYGRGGNVCKCNAVHFAGKRTSEVGVASAPELRRTYEVLGNDDVAAGDGVEEEEAVRGEDGGKDLSDYRLHQLLSKWYGRDRQQEDLAMMLLDAQADASPV
jgi:hypothetical protein